MSHEAASLEIEKLAEPLKPLVVTNGSAGAPVAAQIANGNPKTIKELREIEQSLVQVIQDQAALQDAEKKILEKQKKIFLFIFTVIAG